MSESIPTQCGHPDVHYRHICQLKKEGMNAEVSARTDDPQFICHNCNAMANKAEDLCNCSPLRKRP